MSADLPMRQAKTEEDVQAVVALWNEAKEWLATKGTDQWQYPVRIDSIRQKVAEGAVWLLDNDQGEPIATITLDEDADPRLWKPEDHPEDALYAHRLVVRIDKRHNRVGQKVLEWAIQKARNESKIWLRLDAWTSNALLHEYYLSTGFTLVRVIKDRSVTSGALFQRSTQ